MRKKTRNTVAKISPPKIIANEPSFMILNKPAGWIVNDASTTKDTQTLQGWLSRKYQYELSNNKEMRSGIVHRLDKETSGIMIIAKTEKSFMLLQKQFKERTVKKTYKALLHGILEPAEGEVDAPLGRLPWNRERFGVLPGGRPSYTSYKVERYYKHPKINEKYSWVEFMPRTGRTHQIRIHAKHLHHPIVSDSFYAGRKQSRKDRMWIPHLALIALAIEFENPDTGNRVSFDAPIPSTIKGALRSLEIIETSSVS